ncbi:MAG TPA: hypothetical protein VI875_04300 [Candidatus Norongarragalinales archaeon]|nr:hypothetical protein [Candidatus Norongarragalinales archaeon]
MTMFRTYDVRGIFGKEITAESFFVLGKALEKFSKTLVVGMDYRRNNDLLASALLDGFGGEEVFLGHAPTPAVAFNSQSLGASLTASHNPPEYSGLKPLKQRRCFYAEELSQLKKEFDGVPEKRAGANGAAHSPKPDAELLGSYCAALPEFGNAVFDLAGGAACSIAGIFPKTIFSQPDPLFVRHSPEPTPGALSVLADETRKVPSLGFAFDGDADRCAVVDSGKIVDSGAAAAFFAVNFLAKGSKIVLTLDVQHEVFVFLQDSGFKTEYSPVGDVFVLKKAEEAGADFAAEKAGHYSVFKHMPYSDGIYFAAMLSQAKPGVLNDFARQFKNVFLSENISGASVDFGRLAEAVRETAGSVETMDGVKAAFEDYTLLIRRSNTQPLVRVSVEAKSRERGLEGLNEAKRLVAECKA